MSRLLLICLCSLALAGCPTPPDILVGTGERAPAPYGFVDYCNRHPDRAECGGTQ